MSARAFGLVTSYGITLGVARAVSHIHDQRRPAPMNVACGAGSPTRSATAAICASITTCRESRFAFTSAAVAILRSHDDLGFCLSLAFGTGAGLTFDKILVLLERPTSYWAHQNVAVAQCAAAAVAAAALVTRFHRRGRLSEVS